MATEALTIIVFGIIAGWLTGVLLRGRGYGIIGNAIIGVLGAVFGSVLMRLVGVEIYGWIGFIGVAVVGAVCLLTLLGIVKSGAGRFT